MKFRLYQLQIALLLIIVASCSKNRYSKDITASGTIEATEVHVASQVSGKVKKILVREGNPVNKGDTLAIIDHSTLDLQLKQAEAGVELAKAQLQIDQKDLPRILELFKTGGVAQKQKDDAEAHYRASKARLAQAQASVDLLRKTISDCYLTAPVSGVITDMLIEDGELAGQGATVVTISRLGKVNLMIYLSEIELGRVKLGQQAEVRIDAEPKRIFPGQVVYISPEAEFTPKNVQTKEDRVKLVFGVKIEINNPDGILKPGLPAEAKIIIADSSQRSAISQ